MLSRLPCMVCDSSDVDTVQLVQEVMLLAVMEVLEHEILLAVQGTTQACHEECGRTRSDGVQIDDLDFLRRVTETVAGQNRHVVISQCKESREEMCS